MAVDRGIGGSIEREQRVRERSEVPCDARHHGSTHRPKQRAVVTRFHRGQLRHARLDAVGDPVQGLGALLRMHRSPNLERAARSGDGLARLGHATPRYLRDHALVYRRYIGEDGGGRDTLAADPVVGRNLDAFDRGTASDRAHPLPRSKWFAYERYRVNDACVRRSVRAAT